LFALLYEKFIQEAMCHICSKSVKFYESYGETHFGVFFMPHNVVVSLIIIVSFLLSALLNMTDKRKRTAMSDPEKGTSVTRLPKCSIMYPIGQLLPNCMSVAACEITVEVTNVHRKWRYLIGHTTLPVNRP